MAMHAGLLSIPTSWSKVLEAGHSAGFAARHHLLVRYHEAILNYLRAKLPWDEKGADQLYSDFAIRVLEIDPFLRQADPDRRLRAVLRVSQLCLRQKRARGMFYALDPHEECRPDAVPSEGEERRAHIRICEGPSPNDGRRAGGDGMAAGKCHFRQEALNGNSRRLPLRRAHDRREPIHARHRAQCSRENRALRSAFGAI